MSIDGQFNPGVSNNVNSAVVTECVDGLYACAIELLNHDALDYLYFDRKEFDFGAKIEFAVGLGATNETLFEGYITGLEARYLDGGGSRLTILAEDALQNLRMTRRTRTFEDVSDEDVMNRVAEEHSLQTSFDDLSGPTYRVLAQTNLSDLAFLRQCARRLNAELWIEGGGLHAAPRHRGAPSEWCWPMAPTCAASRCVPTCGTHECTRVCRRRLGRPSKGNDPRDGRRQLAQQVSWAGSRAAAPFCRRPLVRGWLPLFTRCPCPPPRPAPWRPPNIRRKLAVLW